jgi:PAS domain S-box-containing protein
MTSKYQKQKQILAMLNSHPDSEKDQINEYIDQSLPAHSFLRQVFDFYHSMVQHLNAGVMVIDLKGAIQFANRISAGLLGYELDELNGRQIVELFNNTEDGKKFLKECTRRGQRIKEWEAQFFHPNKKIITVGIDSAYMEDVRNQFQGIVLLLRDLTEVVEMRNQVRQMEQLALLGEMAAGLAHEVRNPLAGIKATAQLLEEDEAFPELQRETLRRLIAEVDKANYRIREFLKFARPTRPKPDFHNISEIINSARNLLEAKFKWHKVVFNIEIPSAVAPVFVDKNQIEQVLINLFLNALDAMPNGGQLSVKARRRAISTGKRNRVPGVLLQQHQTYVQIDVQDTGIGIPTDLQGQIFQPFFTTKEEGVGLGLAICNRLVKENGGKIDVSSTPGKGATFSLILPAFAG